MDIEQLTNPTEMTEPLEGLMNDSSSFQIARSHHIPGEEGSPVLSLPPRLPFPPLQRDRSERARSRHGRLRQKPDWTKWPSAMGCKESVSRIQTILTASASGCPSDKSVTTRLFFAIASPLAMAQLHELLSAMRRKCASFPRS
jgi:hypothetical protein